ncbi:uncharacterized protein LOC142352985 [Convolutriloba macropyga]|uniref:uncharacterized protein LOC142352985 n=1 Tax=Convolutriloba macropyga TaxID=536237 RepID=UPI003F525463
MSRDDYFPQLNDEEKAKMLSYLDTVLKEMSVEIQIRQSLPTPLSEEYILKQNYDDIKGRLILRYSESHQETEVPPDSLSHYSGARSTSTSRSGSRPQSLYDYETSVQSLAADLHLSYSNFDVACIRDIIGECMKENNYDEAVFEETRIKVSELLQEWTRQQNDSVVQRNFSSSHLAHSHSVDPCNYQPHFNPSTTFPGSRSAHRIAPTNFCDMPTSSNNFFDEKSRDRSNEPFVMVPRPQPTECTSAENLHKLNQAEERLQRLESCTNNFDTKSTLLSDQRDKILDDHLSNDPYLQEYIDCLKEEEALIDAIEGLECLVVSRSNSNEGDSETNI